MGLRRGPERSHLSMGERGLQTRGPREIGDFVGWEMLGREMGRMGAEDLPTYRPRLLRSRKLHEELFCVPGVDAG